MTVDLTPERTRHGDVIELEDVEVRAGSPKRARNRTQTALDRYLVRGQITRDQFDMGRDLYSLWRTAGGPELRAAGFELGLGPATDIAQHQADARKKLNDIMRGVGNQLSPVLVAVCICDESARDWVVRINGAAPAGIVVLRLALDALAQNWRH